MVYIAANAGLDTTLCPELAGGIGTARARLVLEAGGLAEVSRAAVGLGLGLWEYIPEAAFNDVGKSPVVSWRNDARDFQLAFCDDFYRGVRFVDLAGADDGKVHAWVERLRGELALTYLNDVLARAARDGRTSTEKVRDVRELACLAVLWNDEIASAFLRRLDDEDAEVRFHAVLVANYLVSQPKIGAAFRRIAESDPDPVVRACAAELLQGGFDAPDLPLVTNLAIEPGVPRHRIMSLAWAAKLRFAGRRRETQAFNWISFDRRVGLTYVADPTRAPRLLLCGEPDAVGSLAAELAREPGLLDESAVLASLSSEQDPELCRTRLAQASWMLVGRSVEPAWRGPIERCAAHPDASVRCEAVRALAATGGSGTDILERLSRDDDARVRGLARKLLRVFAVMAPSAQKGDLTQELDCARTAPDGEDDGLVHGVVPRHVKLTSPWPFAQKGWCFQRCLLPRVIGGFIITFTSLDGATTLHTSLDPRPNVRLVAVEGHDAQAVLDAYLAEVNGSQLAKRERDLEQLCAGRAADDDVLARAAELGFLNPSRWGDLYPRLLLPTAVTLRDELSSSGATSGTASDLAAACDSALRGEIVRALERLSVALTADDASRFPGAKALARELLRGSARPMTLQKAWLAGAAAKLALHESADTQERISAIRREISWML
jgi:hypothetical protein